MAIRALLALALAAGAAAQAAVDTTGTTLNGFKVGSNVAGYLKVSADACEFKAALAGDAPKFAAAKALYTAGKNSKKSDGSMRTLRGLASDKSEGQPFYDQYSKYFKSPVWNDAYISAGLDGASLSADPLARREIADKGVQAGVMLYYMMHEMDEAADKITMGELTAAKGAPHNVDEVAALYVGEKSECAPWGLSNKRAAKFGTLATCDASKANLAAIKALNAASAAAAKGDQRAFQAARGAFLSALATTMAQGTLEYANLIEQARAKGEPTAEYQAEGYGFYRAIEPLVAQASASSNQAIRAVLAPGARVAAGGDKAVAAALAKAYPALGITAADVGTFGAKSAVAC